MASSETLLISRHCMQELLRNAVVAESEPFLGLLAGRGNTIDLSIPVRTSGNRPDQAQFTAKGMTLMGVFQSADLEGQTDREKTTFIRECFQELSGCQPGCYLVLELGHAGRLDAEAFADAELTHPIVLEMQEDSSLYPAQTSC